MLGLLSVVGDPLPIDKTLDLLSSDPSYLAIVLDLTSGAPSKTEDALSKTRQHGRLVYLPLPPGKKCHELFLTHCLPQCVAFVGSHLLGLPSQRLTISCTEGGHDLAVGVALTLLQQFFDDDGWLKDSTAAWNMPTGWFFIS